MDNSITRTRIIIPRRRTDFFPRLRLLNLINELLDKKLILVSAPAGYGKTSLLVDFARNSEIPVCWYSIDPLDFEPQRFLSSFIAAINVCFPAFGQRSRTLLQNSSEGNLDVDYLASVVVNDIYEKITEHFVIILDDYHLVNESTLIGKFISHFLRAVDENCHLVLSSRTLLSLPVLPSMVARSEVGGLSFEELAFQNDEIKNLFFQNQGHILSDQAVENLVKKTEGWITGILLTAQISPKSILDRTRINRVSGVGLEDFLLQVLDQQTSEIRNFLLWTSLLEEFNADRCQKVINEALSIPATDWDGLMELVFHNNLFVMPVGEDGSWLRYHHLFLEFLQARIFREKPVEAKAIQQSLAIYYIRQQEWEKAYAIYRRLGLLTELVELIERAGPELTSSGHLATLSAWLDSMPTDLLSSRPSLISLQGNVASLSGDSSLALTLYNQAIGAMKIPDDRKELARALTRRASIHRVRGDLTASLTDAEESLALINNDLQLRSIRAEALRNIGICFRFQSRLKDSLVYLTQALETSQSIRDHKNVAMVQLEIGLVCEALGNYKQSKEIYQAALKYWETTDNSIWLSNVLNNLGALQHITGDYQEAFISLEKALSHARISGYARLEAFALTGIGDIYDELGAIDEARGAYMQARSIAQRIHENFLQVYINLQEASILGLNAKFEEGHKLIDEARNLAILDNSPLEINLCDLERCGLKILENRPAEIIGDLKRVCNFFEDGSQQIQTEKAYLFLTLAYANLEAREELLESLLKLLVYFKSTDSPASLISLANKYENRLEQMKSLDYIGFQLDEFLAEITQFKNQIPTLRRYLRQHALSVPFAPPIIYIRALGKMQVKVNDHLVTSSDWQTQGARDLFFLLLAHPEGMTREEIALVFWPDDSPEDVKFRFKNTIYRVRHALGKQSILLEQDCYRFNNSLDFEYDVELFLRENALAQQAKDNLQKLSHFREAIKLYKGSFLAEIDETWVISIRETLQQNYLNILLQVSEIYFEMSNYDLAIEYCQRSFDVDNCFEAAYRLSFKVYAAMGNRAALVRQYLRCCEVLQHEINAEPSQQTQELYQNLIN